MNIAIYCGSSFGNCESYQKDALKLVDHIAQKNYNIVYGGSKAGIMGIISNYAIDKNIEVFGVIPHYLADKELENERLKNIYKVNDLRERKAKMEELSDAFIAYPGGCGTLEEISEIMTAIQIGSSQKPCAFYNLNGYYDKLIDFLKNAIKEGFMFQEHLDCLIISDCIDEIFEKIENYKAPPTKWEISNH